MNEHERLAAIEAIDAYYLAKQARITEREKAELIRFYEALPAECETTRDLSYEQAQKMAIRQGPWICAICRGTAYYGRLVKLNGAWQTACNYKVGDNILCEWQSPNK